MKSHFFRTLLVTVCTGSIGVPVRPATCGMTEPLTPVDLSFDSSSGTATMVGFDEFGTPSTPPKKYLTKTTSGTMDVCTFSGVTDCSLPTPAAEVGVSVSYSGPGGAASVSGKLTWKSYDPGTKWTARIEGYNFSAPSPYPDR